MPEGRFISRKISVSRQLKQVSLEADFLFGRMIPHLDRDGRMDGDPEIVKAVAVPLRSELTTELIRTCLGELDTVGLIEWYEVDGLTVCEFPGFARHQKGMKHDREAASRYPSREAQGSKSVRRSITSKVSSGSTPDLLRQDDGPTPATSKTDSADVKNGLPLSEVKLSKEKLSKVKLSTASADADSSPPAPTQKSTAKYPQYPDSVCDQLFETHKRVRGAIDYARFRKETAPLFPTDYAVEQLIHALEAWGEYVEGIGPDKARWEKLSGWVENIGRWVRVGEMPLVTLDGVTERGRLACGIVA